MPMYGSPMGYNQPYGGWQATQQLYQPQTNSFMPNAQNTAESLVGTYPWVFVPSELAFAERLYMELENCDYDMVYLA